MPGEVYEVDVEIWPTCFVFPAGYRLELRTPQRAVAPGQSAVIYLGDELLGGGRIVEALR